MAQNKIKVPMAKQNTQVASAESTRLQGIKRSEGADMANDISANAGKVVDAYAKVKDARSTGEANEEYLAWSKHMADYSLKDIYSQTGKNAVNSDQKYAEESRRYSGEIQFSDGSSREKFGELIRTPQVSNEIRLLEYDVTQAKDYKDYGLDVSYDLGVSELNAALYNKDKIGMGSAMKNTRANRIEKYPGYDEKDIMATTMNDIAQKVTAINNAKVLNGQVQEGFETMRNAREMEIISEETFLQYKLTNNKSFSEAAGKDQASNSYVGVEFQTTAEYKKSQGIPEALITEFDYVQTHVAPRDILQQIEAAKKNLQKDGYSGDEYYGTENNKNVDTEANKAFESLAKEKVAEWNLLKGASETDIENIILNTKNNSTPQKYAEGREAIQEYNKTYNQPKNSKAYLTQLENEVDTDVSVFAAIEAQVSALGGTMDDTAITNLGLGSVSMTDIKKLKTHNKNLTEDNYKSAKNSAELLVKNSFGLDADENYQEELSITQQIQYEESMRGLTGLLSINYDGSAVPAATVKEVANTAVATGKVDWEANLKEGMLEETYFDTKYKPVKVFMKKYNIKDKEYTSLARYVTSTYEPENFPMFLNLAELEMKQQGISKEIMSEELEEMNWFEKRLFEKGRSQQETNLEKKEEARDFFRTISFGHMFKSDDNVNWQEVIDNAK